MIIDVIPETKTFSDIESFSYLVPVDLKEKIKLGSIVSVPFGKQKIRGIVEKIIKNPVKNENEAYKLREITSVDPLFYLPAEYLTITKWISQYYLCSIGQAVSLFLPPLMKRPRNAIETKTQIKENHINVALNQEQKEIYDILKLDIWKKNIDNHKPAPRPALIHGVTSSGKTEIYIKMAEDTLNLGKQVVVLVPEIILTPQTVQRFEEIFNGKIALMHHSLSQSEKFACYADFQSGKKPIIIGPRSALLIPSENIGLIIIDEEQEDSYKQEQNPRYHAVTLAEKIADKLDALLVLGSATPRVETYYKAKSGRYRLFEIKKRHNQTELPPAQIVDLRDEFKKDNYSPISLALQAKIGEVLAKKRQILLFLNRRGTATFVSCRDCGFVSLCPHCSIPMVYHLKNQDGFLSCHHCDHREKIPTLCPDCGSSKIKFFGAGVEKIEREVVRLFPGARVAKIDSTTITQKSDYEKFYNDFKSGKIDIVIGTQMIAKGLDIPGVDLVGIVSADTGLHLPHYKASEKSFQLLTQVSGRSGRKENSGQTIIQTYWTEALPILYASTHDYLSFYNQELKSRKEFAYPPYIKLIRIISEDKDKAKAKEKISQLANTLTTNAITFIGPGACFYEKLHNKFRYHLIIKSDKIPNETINKIYKEHPLLTWDVEPVNLL